MAKKVIKTDKAPGAIGPYSQGIEVAAGQKFYFFSGQIALDPKSGQMVAGGVTEQAKRVMENIQGLLQSVGADFSNIVKTTIFLKTMADFAAVNEVYGAHFPKDPPARSTVAVAGLPKEALVEIEVIVSI